MRCLGGNPDLLTAEIIFRDRRIFDLIAFDDIGKVKKISIERDGNIPENYIGWRLDKGILKIDWPGHDGISVVKFQFVPMTKEKSSEK